MGKKKPTITGAASSPNDDPSCSDNMPCPSGGELLSSKKSSHLHDSRVLKPISSRMDAKDKSVKLLNAHSSPAVGRSVFLKRSRHYYGHQYSRRNSGNHANASPSHGKKSSLHSEKLPFKLTFQSGTELGYHTENRGKAFGRPDRIKLSSSVMDSSYSTKTICGICQKLLRRKPCFLGDSLSLGECSIAAVLVCGHVYHADCLEQRTSLEERHDPGCPSCLGLLSEDDTSEGQEECTY